MGRDGVERTLGMGLLLLAIVLALGIGVARIRWEGAYDRVRLAVYGSDLDRGISWEGLQEVGIRAIVVSPRDVSELRAEYFARRRGEPSLSLEDLRAWTARGLLYWDLDAWVPPASFSAYLEDLFGERPRGFVLSFPYALGPWGAEPWRPWLSRDEGVVEFAVREFGGFAQRHELIALYRSGCGCVPVRAHGLSREDRERLSREERLDRYLRAVRERNVRLLLLRAGSLRDLRQDVEALTRRLQGLGFSRGSPLPPGPFEVPVGVLALLWGSAVGGTWIALRRVLFAPSQAPGARLDLLIGGVALGGAAGLLVPIEAVRAAAAWGVAAAAPAIGVFLAYRWVRRPGGMPTPPLPRAVQAFLLAIAVSAAGGLLAAALLGSERYFLKLEEPRGIKAALALPPLVVAVGLLRRYRLRDVRLWDGVVWGGVLLAVGFALLRSENLSSFVWEGEKALREALEDAFGIRPRFKEFLIGHPLLLVGLLLHPSGKRPVTAALLTLGTIGLVSLVNTFLHLHTPLGLTLLRILLGVGLGLLLGLALWGAVAVGLGMRLRLRRRRRLRPERVD